VAVAKDLLGHRLVSLVGGRRCAVRLVEVEAYVGPGDPASHAYRWRRSRRNAAMYGPPGTLYVFFTYGMHWCANVVTEREGLPAAVLLRAGEPLEGIATMRRRRRGATEADLASGPAKLAQALGITGGLDGHALAAPPVWIEAGEPVPARRRAALPRVGVRRGARRCLRFAVRDCPHVSRPRP
jgi:DNA-3-methyladenine glycosylase